MNTRGKSNPAPANSFLHAFPNLKETAADIGADVVDTGTQFERMFNESASQIGSLVKGSQASPDKTDDDPLEKARQKGYQRGIAAGQQKACEMVQSDLSPIVLDLAATIKQLNGYQQDLCETFTTISLKLALHIVEKISGVSLKLQLEDLTEVSDLIRKNLAHTAGVKLTFNPTDFNSMKQLSACEPALAWESYPGITVTSDDNIDPGEIDSRKFELQWDEVNQQVALSLDEIIANKNNLPD